MKKIQNSYQKSTDTLIHTSKHIDTIDQKLNMGCICSLLKALTSSSSSATQNLNPIQLQKKRILREEERKRQEKCGESRKKCEENLIEQNRMSGKRMEEERVHPFDGKRKPNSNIIRSSSQITSSSSSSPSKDEEEEIHKKEGENKGKSRRKSDGREKEENERREKEEENDEKINRKRDEFLTGSKVHSSPSFTMRSKHTNQGEKYDESSSSMSMGTSSESNFVDHNFPDRPTFVHRAPSLRHSSKSSSKSISASVDCVSSNSFPSHPNPMVDPSLAQTAVHSSDPSLVHSHHVSSNSPKISSPKMSLNKRVTFCDHHEQIE